MAKYIEETVVDVPVEEQAPVEQDHDSKSDYERLREFGPSEEQLTATSDEEPVVPDVLVQAMEGQEVITSDHPLDQGGDSARVWLEEHPEDYEANKELAALVGYTPEADANEE